MAKKAAPGFGHIPPIAQSTVLKRAQLTRASDSFTTFSNFPKKARVEV